MANTGEPTSIAGKVVIVTGAGKGLGRAYALHLAGLGARVVVNNRRHAGDRIHSADAVVAEIREQGGEAVPDYSDAQEADCGKQLLERALEHYGQLDAVIANAGVSEAASFHKQSLDDFQRTVDINLMGTARLLHPTFNYFYRQHRGAVLVSSSAAGLYGGHGLPAYSASKAALLGLCRSLALEGASHNVRVNALAPFANTAMTEQSLPESLRQQLNPLLVAPVAAWLVSDECRLNGETLVAGGRQLARAGQRMSAGGHWPQAEDIASVWRAVNEQPLDRDFASAVAMFQAFVGDMAANS